MGGTVKQTMDLIQLKAIPERKEKIDEFHPPYLLGEPADREAPCAKGGQPENTATHPR